MYEKPIFEERQDWTNITACVKSYKSPLLFRSDQASTNQSLRRVGACVHIRKCNLIILLGVLIKSNNLPMSNNTYEVRSVLSGNGRC